MGKPAARGRLEITAEGAKYFRFRMLPLLIAKREKAHRQPKVTLQDKPLFTEDLHDAREAVPIKYSPLALVSLAIIFQNPWASWMLTIKPSVSEGPCAMRSC